MTAKKSGWQTILGGLGKLGSSVVAVRFFQMMAAVWVTRQLEPSQFGILAIVLAVQGLVDRFSALNMAASLVRTGKLETRHVEVAWTFELMRGVLIASGVVLCAPLVGDAFDSAEAGQALRVTALGFLVQGLRNQRVVELQRNYQFGRLALIEAVPPIAYGVCSVIFVILAPSFWALVWAGVASQVARVLVGYLAVPWRPRFRPDFQVAKPMLMFSGILLAGAVIAALKDQGVVFFLAGKFDKTFLGFYDRACAFSIVIGVQVASLIWAVTFPFFSRSERQGVSCRAFVSKMQGTLLLLTGVSAGIVFIWADWIVGTVLGTEWLDMVPAWRWLCIAAGLQLATAPAAVAFQALHLERRALFLQILSAIVVVVLVVLLATPLGLEGVGIAVAVGSLFMLVLHSAVLAAHFRKARPADLRDIGPGS